MFLKVLVVVVSYPGQEAILIFPYINDWLLKGYSFEAVLSSTQNALAVFQELGL